MGRSLRGRFTGVVRYTHELVHALAKRLGPDLTVFLTRAADGLDGLNVRRVRARFATPNEYVRAFWEQAVVPVEVARLRPHVYHSPNYILPLALRCPSVVTVHDVAFLNGSIHRLRSHLYLSVLTALALRKATRVICVSQFTRAQLARRFPHCADRIRVIGEGIHPRFVPLSPAAGEHFRRWYGVPAPYVLFVGTIEPRKNLARLIRAFGMAVGRTTAPHHLAIVGARGWKDGPVAAALAESPVRERIHFPGYVADEDLPAAYSGADVFAYPSLYEGFGLPPLEAMACGSAVLTSRTTALPEVVGDAALTVDPASEEEIAAGLVRLLTEPETREALAAAGLARATSFRWDTVAEQTMAVYAEALG